MRGEDCEMKRATLTRPRRLGGDAVDAGHDAIGLKTDEGASPERLPSMKGKQHSALRGMRVQALLAGTSYLPTKLPYGNGSIQRRRRYWYLIYRDPEGALVQESSRTEDQAEAQRLLAQRALPTHDARRALLYQVAYGEETAGTGRKRSEPK